MCPPFLHSIPKQIRKPNQPSQHIRRLMSSLAACMLRKKKVLNRLRVNLFGRWSLWKQNILLVLIESYTESPDGHGLKAQPYWYTGTVTPNLTAGWVRGRGVRLCLLEDPQSRRRDCAKYSRLASPEIMFIYIQMCHQTSLFSLPTGQTQQLSQFPYTSNYYTAGTPLAAFLQAPLWRYVLMYRRSQVTSYKEREGLQTFVQETRARVKQQTIQRILIYMRFPSSPWGICNSFWSHSNRHLSTF